MQGNIVFVDYDLSSWRHRIEETHCLDRLSIILTADPNLKVIRSCQKTWEKELSFQMMDA